MVLLFQQMFVLVRRIAAPSLLFALAWELLLVLGVRFAVEDGVVILGPQSFVEETENVLRLLKEQDPAAHGLITRHLDVIASGPRSRVYAAPVVSFCTIAPRTRQAGTAWYASTLAHEAYHVFLQSSGYRWQGSEAEQACLGYQRDVARIVGANADLLQHLDGALALRYWETQPSTQDW